MFRKVVSGIVLMLLLTSMLTLAFNIQPANAEGTIYIRADGSVDPPTAPIQRDENIYTFTDDINDSIVVERSNIIIDGTEYTLQGNESGSGFYLSNIDNVTIKKTKIKGFTIGIELRWSSRNSLYGNNITNNNMGILLRYSSENAIYGNNVTANNYGRGIGIDVGYVSSKNTIFGNNITNNKRGVYLSEQSNENFFSKNVIANNSGWGIHLDYWWYSSFGNNVNGNKITNNGGGIKIYTRGSNRISTNYIANNSGYGIYIDCTPGNILRNNTINDNEYNFGVSTRCAWAFYQDIDATNTVDGKSIYYWVNHRDKQIPHDAGYVTLINSINITIEGVSLTRNAQGVLIVNTTNSKITNNNLINNAIGIYIKKSSGNTISGNNITDNYYGVSMGDSSASNEFYHNNFLNNTQQVYSDSINVWDDGYPSGGNYWSDYTDVDLYSGPYQNETSSDGIWDHPYVIDENNRDRYPLVNPWTPTPVPELKIGDIVETNVYLHVRNISDWNNPLDPNNLVFTMHPPDERTKPPYDVGKIIDGPRADDLYGYTWWKIKWDNGEVGWSAEKSLEEPPERWLVKTDKSFIKIQDLEYPFDYQGEYELNETELENEEKSALSHVMKYAMEYKISPALIMAMIRQESDFNASAKGDYWDGKYHSFGYMQVSYAAATDTYKEYTGDEYKGTEEEWESDGLDPDTNIKYGVRYLRIQHDRIKDGCPGYEDVYGDIVKSTISAYNAGHPTLSNRKCYVVGGYNEKENYVGVIEGKPVNDKHRGYKFFLSIRALDTSPPTCVIKLQEHETASQIDSVDIGKFFDIYVGQSADNVGIREVRFSSDDSQDSISTGEWTEWYDWDTSSGDWNAETKIKKWSFATGGKKEVWAEVKDGGTNVARCHANLFVHPGYAIIVSGGGKWKSTFDHCANNAYRVLRNLGFDDDHIFYLNSKSPQDIDRDGDDEVDAPASLSDFENVLNEIRVKRGENPVLLIIYLVGHGVPDAFLFDGDNLPVWKLKEKLDEFSSDTRMLIVINSCYSGSFIAPTYPEQSVSATNRIIITTTHNDQHRGIADWYFGQRHAFVWVRSSDRFWGNLNKGLNVKEAFTQRATAGDNWHLWLDDNGDKTGHSPNNLEDDGALAAATEIGIPGMENLVLTPWQYLWKRSPGELRVYDSQNRVTGLVNGTVKEEIPDSMYDEENEVVAIFSSYDIYRYEIAGTETGTYGLDVASVEDGNATIFTAIDIPTSVNAIHQYTIDWVALSIGEEGVTVQIDSDGDCIFEYTFTSDSELTHDEFVQQTPQTYVLTITTTVGGTTDPPPGTHTYTANSSIQVTATPNADYAFDRWELDTIDVGSANPYTVLMDNNHTLNAVFIYSPPPPPLSASISPLSASILVGQSVTFTSTVTGGVTPYSYQWYLNGDPVSGATSDTWTFTPSTSGIYYVYLRVADDVGNTTQSETVRITVATVPVGGYSIPIEGYTTTKSLTLYLALVVILTASFTMIKRKTPRRSKRSL